MNETFLKRKTALCNLQLSDGPFSNDYWTQKYSAVPAYLLEQAKRLSICRTLQGTVWRICCLCKFCALQVTLLLLQLLLLLLLLLLSLLLL